MQQAVEEVRELLRRRRKVAFGRRTILAFPLRTDLSQFGADYGGVFALMVAISSVGL